MLMYFATRTSRGKQILQLLESYRNADGQPRNRVVMSLGMRKLDKARGKLVAQVVESELYDHPLLLSMPTDVVEEANEILSAIRRKGTWLPIGEHAQKPPPETSEAPARTVDGVFVDQVSVGQTTSLGPELLALHAWRKLNMDSLLEGLNFNPAQRQAATVQVIGRMVAPGSELALTERFLAGSSLPDLLDLKHDTKINKDRYYRVSDQLLGARDAIELYMQETIAGQLSLQRTYYLYDLTNTHFAGICEKNPKAQRGKSKQKRNDCPLVAAGVCFDEHGFILFHRTFAGNTGDATTLPEMIEILQNTLSDQHLSAPPIVVLDGGLGTAENLETLRKAKINYLVNRTRSFRNHFSEIFAEATFEQVPDRKVQVSKLAKGQLASIEAVKEAEHGDQFVLCRSTQRGLKESAIRSRADERLLEALEKLRTRISKGQLKQPKKIHEAIGRLREGHSQVARYYQISCQDGALSWEHDDARMTGAADLDGCYVLQAHAPTMTAVELWRRYMVLTKAEAGFRCIKGQLGLRPNFHRLAHLVDGHIFISLLAYQLMRFICYSLEQCGDTRNWATLRDILRSHCYATSELPTSSGEVHRVRKPGRPEPLHRQIYSHLGIDLAALPTQSSCYRQPV